MKLTPEAMVNTIAFQAAQSIAMQEQIQNMGAALNTLQLENKRLKEKYEPVSKTAERAAPANETGPAS